MHTVLYDLSNETPSIIMKDMKFGPKGGLYQGGFTVPQWCISKYALTTTANVQYTSWIGQNGAGAQHTIRSETMQLCPSSWINSKPLITLAS